MPLSYSVSRRKVMADRPTIGAVGVAISALAPDGEAEFDGDAFCVRAQGGRIDSGRSVLVTGFDPWSLTVREATSEEVAAYRPAAPTELAQSGGKGALWAIGAVVFGSLLVFGGLWAFQFGGLAGGGFLLAVAGQVWLFTLMVRECRPDAVILALLIPFFLWYFAWQRWDITKWAFLVNVLGLVVNLWGLLAKG
jgi:membrane-bound ClpP family serine protease